MSTHTPPSFASTPSARPELVRQNSAPSLAGLSSGQGAPIQPIVTADGSIRWRPSTANAVVVESFSTASTPALRYAEPSAQGAESRPRPGSAPSSVSIASLLEQRPYTAVPTLESTLYTPTLEERPLRFDDMDGFMGGATELSAPHQNQPGQTADFAFSAQYTEGHEDLTSSQRSASSTRTHTLSSDTTLVGSDSLTSIYFGGNDVGKFLVNGSGDQMATDMTQLLTAGESSLMQESMAPATDIHLAQIAPSEPNASAASSSQAFPTVSPSFEQMEFDQDSEMDEDEDAEHDEDSDQDGSGVSDTSGHVPQFSVFGPLRPDLNPLLNLGSLASPQRQLRSPERDSRPRSDSASSRKTNGGAQRTTRNTTSTARHHASSVLGGAGLGLTTRTRASSDAKKVATNNMSSSVISSILGTQAGAHICTQSLGHDSGIYLSDAASQAQYTELISHPEAQHALQQLRDLANKNRSTAEGRLRNRAYMNESYRAMCKTFGLRPLNPSTFGRLVRTHFPRILTRRLGPRGNSRYHYTGLSAKFLRSDEGDEATISRRASLASTKAQRKSVTQVTKELTSVRTERPALPRGAPPKSSAPVVPSSARPGSSLHRRAAGNSFFAQSSFTSTPQSQSVPGLPSIGVGSMTPSPSYSNAQLGSSGTRCTPLLLSSPVLTSEGQMIPFGNVSMQGRQGYSSYPSDSTGVGRGPSSHQDEMSFTMQTTPSISSTVGSSSSSAAPSTMSFGLQGTMDASFSAEQQHHLRQSRSMPFQSLASMEGHQFGTTATPGVTTMLVAPAGFTFDMMGFQGVNSMMELASAAMNSMPGMAAGSMAHLQQCGPAAVAASMMLPSPTSWSSSLSGGPYTDHQAGPAF
ncbi:hypothetical protein OC861_000324 [Tilletia horrida]|nr:hypothetical protein OC861_000324 [Tilletia horrida]